MELNPNNIEAYSNLINLLQIQRRYSEAEEFGRKLVKLFPESSQYKLILSVILFKLGKDVEFINLLNYIIETEKIDYKVVGKAYFSLGIYHFDKKNLNEAESLLKKALTYNPKDFVILFFLMEINLVSNNIKEVQDIYNNILTLFKKDFKYTDAAQITKTLKLNLSTEYLLNLAK